MSLYFLALLGIAGLAAAQTSLMVSPSSTVELFYNISDPPNPIMATKSIVVTSNPSPAGIFIKSAGTWLRYSVVTLNTDCANVPANSYSFAPTELSTSTPARICVAAAGTNPPLDKGYYSGALTLIAGSTQVTVGVNLSVSPAGYLQLSKIPQGTTFNAQDVSFRFDAGTPPPISIQVNVFDNNGIDDPDQQESLKYDVKTNDGSPAPWVVTNLTSLTSPAILTINVNPSLVPLGQHCATPLIPTEQQCVIATVTIASTSGFKGQDFVRVYATPPPVTATISLSSQLLSFNYQPGGASPPNQPLTITSSPSGVQFSLLSDANWITANITSGTTPATISVGVDITRIPVGSPAAVLQIVSVAAPTVMLTISATAGPSFVGSMPHIAAQENWSTTFTLVNKSAATSTARLSFFGDATDPTGNGPLLLPLVFQPPVSGPLLSASVDQTLASNASLTVTTAGPQTSPVLVGSAQLSATGAVDGFAIFHQIPTAQEAVVPMETRNASSYLLAFDNTNGLVLGVAVENVSAQNAVIPVIVRDDAGNIIGTQRTSISLGGNGHTSFVLSDPTSGFPETAEKRGTIEFDTPQGGQISVLGLRFTPPNNALTTIPALANVGTGGGSIAHLASGGDGWQTTFVLVNTGATATSVTLSFFNDQTGLPLPLPLSFPQSGTANMLLAASHTQPLAAGATLIVVSAGFPQLLTGSAQLSTTGNVSGFVIFRHNNQEAVVPLESRNASAYVLAFDNTSGTATGIAVNAVSAGPVSIPVVVRDDTGTPIATDTIALAANGHTAFTLGSVRYPAAATIRGTIEFDTPTNTQIGALGIRMPAGAAHTYTTLPALAK